MYVDALNAQGMVQVCGMPLFHIVGCGLTVLGTIAGAGSLVLMPALRPGPVDPASRRRARRVLFRRSDHAVIARLEHPPLADTDVSSVRVIVAAGAPVLPALVSRIEAAFGARLCIGFGQTETSGCVSLILPDDEPNDRYNTMESLWPRPT